jgi:hypothetical protein
MVNDNIGTVIADSAKKQALSAVGLERPESGSGVVKAAQAYADDAAKQAGIVGGIYQAVDYSADPGGSSGGKPTDGGQPNSGSSGA